ncbi:NAC domain-containing protein 82-like [Juglans regia]|uniref:NAC domain-containing protein 82-like n=1 Tax=Juglans regia TaxID=51240 RepID=A0A6P9EA38_JUGRE|nr:NAC domain-containing protein 82-like [Juglans regia]
MNYLIGKKSLLPLGFRFHPTDVELVMYYLKWIVMGKEFCFEAIAEVDIYKFAPWGLPVLCMIFQKDGLGPRNGAQYCAPFKEEDWNDDDEVNCEEAGPPRCFSTPTCVLPSDCNSSAITCNLFWIAFFLSHVYLKLWHLTARVFQQFPLMISF